MSVNVSLGAEFEIVISPVEVIAPVTASVDPSKVRFASALKLFVVPVAVKTLLFPSLLNKSAKSVPVNVSQLRTPAALHFKYWLSVGAVVGNV